MSCCSHRDLMLRTSRFCFCDSHEVLLCVRVCVCAIHIFVNLNDSIPHFLWISKAPAQHIKQWYDSSSSGRSSSHLTIYMGAPVFPLCNLRHPRDLKSTTSRKGTLYVMTTVVEQVDYRRSGGEVS